MILAATLCLVLAALGGALMATLHFTNRPIPSVLPIGHGLLALAGLIVLAAGILTQDLPVVAWVAFGLFVLTAVGGGVVVKPYLKKKPLSSGMIIVHAMLAIMSFIFLASYLFAASAIEGPVSGPIQVQETP